MALLIDITNYQKRRNRPDVITQPIEMHRAGQRQWFKYDLGAAISTVSLAIVLTDGSDSTPSSTAGGEVIDGTAVKFWCSAISGTATPENKYQVTITATMSDSDVRCIVFPLIVRGYGHGV